MGNVLPLVSMIAGLGASAMAFVASNQQPAKATQLRRVGIGMLAWACVMGLFLLS